MPARSRVLTKDEELGKRDDDFRPAHSRTSAISAMLPWHWRRRRLLLVIVLAGLVYVFMQSIPTSTSLNDHGSFDIGWQRPRNIFPSHPTTSRSPAEPIGAPPREGRPEDDEQTKYYYNGPIKFWKLGETLRSLPFGVGNVDPSRNVLFAASSVKSFANLLPMACEMAKQNQAYAHVALFGRSTLPIAELLEVSGVDKSSCAAYFHDARGDYAEFSSDYRAKISVAGAMMHIQEYMDPQALIIDDESLENRFFLDAMAGKAKQMGRPLIQIPKGRYMDFIWITRLDAGSLSSWYTPTVDIVIQAPPGSAGSLIRLLKSLASADYDAIKVPRLTVELPTNPEAFVVGFLARMKWPPKQDELSKPSNSLTVRHRIPSSKFNADQASLHFLESFFPADPNSHHTLILSPQAQVDRHYMQLLHYLILKYRHSSSGSPGSEDLLGLSLESRSYTLNGTKFSAPTLADMASWTYQEDRSTNKDAPSSFIYQAPTSGAALVFGDKWVALHSFLANRLAATHLGKATQVKKLVPETEPAWMEYVLELMKVRGWSMMHPASSFVTLHNELAQIPEEFLRTSNDNPQIHAEQADATDNAKEEAFLIAEVPPVLSEHSEYDISNNFGPLHQILPLKGVLPDIYEMPSYSHEGNLLSGLDIYTRATDFKAYFRTAIGGCPSNAAEQFRQIDRLSTNDLFCLPGMGFETSDEGNVDDASEDLSGSFETDSYAFEPTRIMTDPGRSDVKHTGSANMLSGTASGPTSAANLKTKDETEADIAVDVP